MARYEINHEGKIVESVTELCKNKDEMIINLFSQFGWKVNELEKDGPFQKLSIEKDSFETIILNVFSGNIRNESRNDYEKKIQLNGKDPIPLAEENTIILGVYTFKKNDTLADTLFVGYPIDKNVKYNTNPSLRGAFINGVLVNGKNKGFYFDKEKNLAAFRPEFIFYYLENYKNLHYSEANTTTEPSEQNNFKHGDNIILYGVPGCGKSHEIKTKYCNDKKFMERVVFHPDYTYSDFIGQILPKTDGDKISYPFTPGPFTTILKKAIDDPNKNNMYYLVIEEINRGNAPAIFGEVFQLLDREKGESEYGINNFDIAAHIYGPEKKEDEIKIPSNLTILATMNTADQNVFTLDTAFKRRWHMKMIQNQIEKCKFAYDYICDTSITWIAFVTAINQKITEFGENNIGNEDTRLGAYFIEKEDLKDADLFSEKVLMYLWSDAFKFDRTQIFKSEYKTLEDLISAFKTDYFDIFNESVKFEIQPAPEASATNVSEYLANKNSNMINIYESLINVISEKINDFDIVTTKNLLYIALKKDNRNIAEIYIQKDKVKILTKEPTNPELLIGRKLPKSYAWTNDYEIFVNESNTDTVANAIVNAYNL